MNKTIAVLALAVISTAAFAQVTIYSNNVGGDAFTNPGGTGANQQINSPTGYNNAFWSYTEVKNGGTVGIDTAKPMNGNGSAHFNVPANGSGGRADMTLRDTSLGYLGNFDDVTHWSADTFTQSGIPSATVILRLELFSASAGLYGSLVFAPFDTPSFNAPVTSGQWNTFDFFAPSNGYMLSATSSLGTAYGAQMSGGTPKSFADWQTSLSGDNFVVLSANMGWGTATSAFEGFADNYTLGFNGQATTYDFEAVPEPMTMGILAAGAALAARRRKKK